MNFAIEIAFYNMSRKLVVANWKMNLTLEQAKELIQEVASKIIFHAEVALAVPIAYLHPLKEFIMNKRNIHLAAQNVHQEEFGAFTGELSAPMLASLGVEYCIVGHSERRTHFKEKNEILAQKISQLLKHEITPIYCVGETLEQREKGKTFDVIKKQLKEGITHLTSEEVEQIIIAYEPVWAIGTGKTATPVQAEEVHAFIRKYITQKYNEDVAHEIPLLYGGSITAENAESLFAEPNIDGGLVGGASLKAEDFIKIVNANFR